MMPHPAGTNHENGRNSFEIFHPDWARLDISVSLTALFSYINIQWLKLPSTIGVMLLALLSSLSLAGLKAAAGTNSARARFPF